jgi:hypothetical protein
MSLGITSLLLYTTILRILETKVIISSQMIFFGNNGYSHGLRVINVTL